MTITLSNVIEAYNTGCRNEVRADYHNTTITVMGVEFRIYENGDMYRVNGVTGYRSCAPIYKTIYKMLKSR